MVLGYCRFFVVFFWFIGFERGFTEGLRCVLWGFSAFYMFICG